MILDYITEISIHSIPDRGIPNRERIILYIRENLNIGQFGIMLGLKTEGGAAYPMRDNLFWFGDVYLQGGDWIFLYTCPGSPRTFPIPNTNNTVYIIHWGREKTILANPELTPILFRIDSVIVYNSIEQIPQIERQSRS